MTDATARLTLNTALYERAAVESAAATFAEFATIEIAPAGGEPTIELSIQAHPGYALSDVGGEVGNPALVSTIDIRRGV